MVERPEEGAEGESERAAEEVAEADSHRDAAPLVLSLGLPVIDRVKEVLPVPETQAVPASVDVREAAALPLAVSAAVAVSERDVDALSLALRNGEAEAEGEWLADQEGREERVIGGALALTQAPPEAEAEPLILPRGALSEGEAVIGAEVVGDEVGCEKLGSAESVGEKDKPAEIEGAEDGRALPVARKEADGLPEERGETEADGVAEPCAEGELAKEITGVVE